MWEKVRLLVFSSKIASISFFFLLLLIGMGTASIVNWISVTPVFAKSFYLGVVIAGTMIFLGILIFQPFFTFRFRYKFLDEYEEVIASLIHRFKRKAESRLINTDGVIGIRLFRVEKHTLPEDSLYVFNIVFDLVSKYSSIDKLKPKEIKVPIALDKWIQKNIIENIENTNVQYDIKALNEMKMDKYTTQMLLYYFVEYFREKNEGKNERWYKKNIKKAIGKWKVKIHKKKLFKSVHYSTVFFNIPSLKVYVNTLEEKVTYTKEQEINSNFVYIEDYKNNNKDKKHRRYVDLHFRMINEIEGEFDFILQVIIDKRIIPSEEPVLLLLNDLL